VKSASLKEGIKHEERKHHGLCRRLEKYFIQHNRTVILINETYNITLKALTLKFTTIKQLKMKME